MSQRSISCDKNWRRVQHLCQKQLCAYCLESLADKKVTVEHIVPRAWGGPNRYFNRLLVCNACNQYKSGWESMIHIQQPEASGFERCTYLIDLIYQSTTERRLHAFGNRAVLFMQIPYYLEWAMAHPDWEIVSTPKWGHFYGGVTA